MADNDHVSTKIVVPVAQAMVSLLGSGDELLAVIERALASDVHVRGNEITLTGKPADNALAVRLFEELISLLERGQQLSGEAVERTLAMLQAGGDDRPADVLTLNILSNRGRTIRPKTVNQKRYVEAIDRHTIVFAIGPAGTGKTYLAMAKAVQSLQGKQVNRIILTRPAVEAGERLGFLPGTLYEKIDPYLRPLYDALHDMLDPDSIPKLMAAGTIEVAPLAYMRGRAQPVDTPVLTPAGFRPIGELSVGDWVVGSDGRPTPVLGIYPQGRTDVYRVSCSDGASTLACGEHLWHVATRDDRRRGRAGRVLATRQLLSRLQAANDGRLELPVVAPVAFPEIEVPLDPYVLGLLQEQRRVPALTARDAAGARSTTVFPSEYLLNTIDVRLALLQGLLDGDGQPVPQAGQPCRVEYVTGRADLRDDVVFLVRSLGGVAVTQAQRGDAHVLDIRLPEGMPPFRQTHKRNVYDATGGRRPVRFIDSIDAAGAAECVCIAVGAENSLYVTTDFLVTHNTLNDAFIILDEAQNTSPEQMKMFLTRLGFGSKIVVTGDVTQVDLPTGTTSGLRIVRDILDGVEDVHFARLDSTDVVRHRLVSRIVDAYEQYDDEQKAARGPQRSPGRRDDAKRSR